jgi:hypothetical protein
MFPSFPEVKSVLQILGDDCSSNWQTMWSKSEFFRGRWINDLRFGENFYTGEYRNTYLLCNEGVNLSRVFKLYSKAQLSLWTRIRDGGRTDHILL